MNEMKQETQGKEPYKRELQLQDIINLLLSGWKIILLFAVVFGAWGAFTAWRAVPYYEVDAKILFGAKEKGVQQVVDDFGGDIFSESQIAVEIELLKSRSVISQTVENLGLDLQVIPNYYSVIGEPMARRKKYQRTVEEPFLGLEEYAWGGERVVVDSFNIPKALRGVAFILEKKKDDQYFLKTPQGKIIGQGKVGEPLTITYSANAISLSISTFNARPKTKFFLIRHSPSSLAGAIHSKIRTRESSKGVLTVSYVDADPLNGARVLNEIVRLYMVHNFQRQTDEVGNTLTFLNEQLPALRDNVEESEKKLNWFKYKINSIDLDRETSLRLGRIDALRSDVEKVEVEIQELLQHYKKSHPTIKSLEDKHTELTRQLADANTSAKKIPRAQQTLQKLQRDVEINNKLYIEMLNKFQQLQVVKAGQKGNVSIVDVAVPARSPKGPQRLKMVVVKIFMGVFLGLAIAVVRRLWGRGVDDIDYLEAKLGIKNLALIPHSDEQDEVENAVFQNGVPLLVVQRENDIAVESLRSLRTNIHFNRTDDSSKVLMIVGPSPGIGKSFVTANLAASIAQSGFSVLLVDGDMRKGHLHASFGGERDGGLAEILAATATIDDVMRQTEQECLSFISTGAIPRQPAELLMNRRFEKFLSEVKTRFDYVIFDAPPILAVTDAGIIGKQVDMTIFLVRHEQHSMKEIEAAKRQLDHAGVAITGLVVNDIHYKQSGRKMKNENGYVLYQYGAGEVEGKKKKKKIKKVKPKPIVTADASKDEEDDLLL
ncbi:MAG: polysaccharide biosynthesis tyrosine autokinase [Fibrobacterales bacterium]